jgi:hypothetical protein
MPSFEMGPLYGNDETGLIVSKVLKRLRCVIVLVSFKGGHTIILNKDQMGLLFTTIKDELREPY